MHLNCLKKVMQASKLVKGHLNNSDQSTFVYDTMHYAQQLQCCCTYTLMLNTFRKHARTSSSKNGREIPFPDNETLVSSALGSPNSIKCIMRICQMCKPFPNTDALDISLVKCGKTCIEENKDCSDDTRPCVVDLSFIVIYYPKISMRYALII